MKIFLLIIPSIVRSAGTSSNQTYHITKEVSQKLNNSIPLFKNIASKVKKTNEFNNSLHIGWFSFKDIKNTVSLTGEMSQQYLNLSFSIIQNLEQLNKFNEELTSSENIIHSFTSIVISLINNIFESIPEQDVEISNESNCLMRFLKMDNPNKIIISVTHKYDSTQIRFRCYLEEETKTIVHNFNPEEEEEEEEEKKPLLYKKQE